MANDLGFETSHDELDDDATGEITGITELPESVPDFDFENNTTNDSETSFEIDNDIEEDIDFSNETLEENDFSSESDFSENNDFNDEASEDNQTDDDFDFEVEQEQLEDVQAIEAIEEIENVDDSEFKPTSEFIQEEELAVAPPVTEKVVKTAIQNTIEKTHSTSPEEFEDIKDFAKNMRHQNFSSEGNPPFSIILKKIKFVEDAEDIADILIKFKVGLVDQRQELIQTLSKGVYLIPRLSEYAAITLCHQLRMFDLEILMGLTEEINPPKSYESADRGSTSKRTLLANKKHNFNLKDQPLYAEILTTTLPQLSGYQIAEYRGIASESRIIDTEILTLSSATNLESEILEELDENERENLKLLQLKRRNQKASESKFGFNYQDFYGRNSKDSQKIGLEHIYAELITNMKTNAKTAKANAIVGISFSISPISLEEYLNQGPRYQVLCTGNMVWIEKA